MTLMPGQKCVVYTPERVAGKIVSVNRDGKVVVGKRDGGWITVNRAQVRQAVVR